MIMCNAMLQAANRPCEYVDKENVTRKVKHHDNLSSPYSCNTHVRSLIVLDIIHDSNRAVVIWQLVLVRKKCLYEYVKPVNITMDFHIECVITLLEKQVKGAKIKSQKAFSFQFNPLITTLCI